MLLDILMPSGDGFDLLNALADPPHVVFVTAHDRFAIRAFEVNALDYLLKPINRDRFNAAITRAVQAIRSGSRRATDGVPLDANDIALVEVGHSGHFVSVSRILAIESHGNHTRLTLDEGPPLVARQPVKHWVDRLPPELFVQLGRSLVVNVRQIKTADVAARDAVIVLGKREHTIRLGAAAILRLREVLPK
jgi:two-component system LytT family response regulator